MVSLKQIKKNITNLEINSNKHLENYKIGNTVPILTKIIKKENLFLLNWLILYKKIENTNDFIQKYHKLNYYCPIIKNI